MRVFFTQAKHERARQPGTSFRSRSRKTDALALLRHIDDGGVYACFVHASVRPKKRACTPSPRMPGGRRQAFMRVSCTQFWLH